MRRAFALILILLWLLTAYGMTAYGQSLQGERWSSAYVPAHRVQSVDEIVARILLNRGRYEKVDAATGVPWYVIGSLHNMEAGGSFTKHLHEGSSLAGRTRYEPKGRPISGSPPFTWEYSAVDALTFDKMGEVDWSSLTASLYACERYNGTGYLKYHADVPTPYLWSRTSLYVRGKYIADGKWSSTAISEQVGVAAIWKRLEARGVLDFNRLKP